ncbi:hypothetical protein C2G38_2215339 [Gigaspora rosea]|uniref:Uncharacterized protein n=1 Tax=Gigaspora rosea TaxID=44941 RepID=A0A397UDH8_9GLOM|nr:hypothetical protein C2G38_2215339 [Gigaspora rosea]
MDIKELELKRMNVKRSNIYKNLLTWVIYEEYLKLVFAIMKELALKKMSRRRRLYAKEGQSTYNTPPKNSKTKKEEPCTTHIPLKQTPKETIGDITVSLKKKIGKKTEP